MKLRSVARQDFVSVLMFWIFPADLCVYVETSLNCKGLKSTVLPSPGFTFSRRTNNRTRQSLVFVQCPLLTVHCSRASTPWRQPSHKKTPSTAKRWPLGRIGTFFGSLFVFARFFVEIIWPRPGSMRCPEDLVLGRCYHAWYGTSCFFILGALRHNPRLVDCPPQLRHLLHPKQQRTDQPQGVLLLQGSQVGSIAYP